MYKEVIDCNSKGIRNYGQQYIDKYFIDIQSFISEDDSSDMLPSSLPCQPVSNLCVIRGLPRMQPASYYGHSTGRLSPLYAPKKTRGNPTAHNENIVCNMVSFNISNLQKNSTY